MARTYTVAIMQPYFLPYIGYWQLMNHVDAFVVYDDIQYTKKGWINRNRFLLNGRPETFYLPLKKDSDFQDVRERQLSDTFHEEKASLMRRLEAAYRAAPFFAHGRSLLADVLDCNDMNLFNFIYNSLEVAHARLGMTSRLIVSSDLGISRELSGQGRVIATCKVLGATDYINPIGGVSLYERDTFAAEGINLSFQSVRPYHYPQFGDDFVPDLSIIDVVMFLGLASTRSLIKEMDLS